MIKVRIVELTCESKNKPGLDNEMNIREEPDNREWKKVVIRKIKVL